MDDDGILAHTTVDDDDDVVSRHVASTANDDNIPVRSRRTYAVVRLFVARNYHISRSDFLSIIYFCTSHD
jgi:hypothetical protein